MGIMADESTVNMFIDLERGVDWRFIMVSHTHTLRTKVLA